MRCLETSAKLLLDIYIYRPMISVYLDPFPCASFSSCLFMAAAIYFSKVGGAIVQFILLQPHIHNIRTGLICVKRGVSKREMRYKWLFIKTISFREFPGAWKRLKLCGGVLERASPNLHQLRLFFLAFRSICHDRSSVPKIASGLLNFPWDVVFGVPAPDLAVILSKNTSNVRAG